jgi:LDH2 family malate/lactate/ureidoglycolate dehydrogenase
MTDMLTGVLSGGAFGLTPYSKPTAQEVAHTFICFDIAWFMPVAEFKVRIDAFIAECKAAKLRPGFTEILVPGELEYRREQEHRQHGAQLDSTIFDALAELAREINVEFPFEREIVVQP